MPFKQTYGPQDFSSPPCPRNVVRWLWQVNECDSPIVKKHGQTMLDVYFDSKKSAEIFLLQGKEI